MHLMLKEDTWLHKKYILMEPGVNYEAVVKKGFEISDNFETELKRKIDVACRIINLVENKDNVTPKEFRLEILDLFDVSGYDDESIFAILSDNYNKKYVNFSEINYLLKHYQADKLSYSQRFQEHFKISSWHSYLSGITVIISSDVKLPIYEYSTNELKSLIESKDIIPIRHKHYGDTLYMINYDTNKKPYIDEDADYLKELATMPIDSKNIFLNEEFVSASAKYMKNNVTITILVRKVKEYLESLTKELERIVESCNSNNYNEKETAKRATNIINSSKVLDTIKDLMYRNDCLIERYESFKFMGGYLYNMASRNYYHYHYGVDLKQTYLASVSSNFEIVSRLDENHKDYYIVIDNSKLLEDATIERDKSPKKKFGVYKIENGEVTDVVLPTVYDNIHYYGGSYAILEYNKLYTYIYFGHFSYSQECFPLTPLVLESASPFDVKYPGFAECMIDGEVGFIPCFITPTLPFTKDNLLTENDVKKLLFGVANYDQIACLHNKLEKTKYYEDIKTKKLFL